MVRAGLFKLGDSALDASKARGPNRQPGEVTDHGSWVYARANRERAALVGGQPMCCRHVDSITDPRAPNEGLSAARYYSRAAAARRVQARGHRPRVHGLLGEEVDEGGNGIVAERARRLGYSHLVRGGRFSANLKGTSPYDLQRITIARGDSLREFAKKVSGAYHWLTVRDR